MKILSTILYFIQKNQPLDEKPVENSQNSQIPDETPTIAINGLDKLPDENVEKILIQAIKSSDHVCETYNNITDSCSRFQIIGKKGKCCFLVFLSNQMTILRSRLIEIKVIVRKLLKSFVQGRELIIRVSELIDNKNWKSAYLILLPDRNSWCTIQRIY